MSAALLILPVLLPLSAAALLLLAAPSGVRLQRWGLVGATGLMLGAAAALLAVVARGDEALAMQLGGWQVPLGILFYCDLFSAIMIAATALVGFAGALYATGEVGALLWKRRYAVFYLVLLAGVNGSFLTADLFNLFVWFEVMLMSSFALMVMGRRKYTLEGSAKYVVLNVFASFLFLSGLGILYGKTGTLNLFDLASKLGGDAQDPLIFGASGLLLVAFGIKAGVFPLYFWLPPSYPNTGFTSAAVFGGLLTKVGLYALIRVFGGALRNSAPELGQLLVVIGVLTMVMGVFGAASQFQVRRILSIHIASQIGYMVVGLGLFTQGALAVTIFYLVQHMLVKTNLFFMAGMMARTARSERLERLGGLARSAPALAVLFLLSALSLAGVPPSPGFFAKFLLFREAVRAEAFVAGAAMLAVGILTLYSMTKVWSEGFWKDSPRRGGPERFARSQLIPVGLLTVAAAGLALAVAPALDLAERAAAGVIATGDTAASLMEADAGSDTGAGAGAQQGGGADDR